MSASILVRTGCAVVLCLLVIGCGGGGGGLTAEYVAAKVSERANEDASCSETTEEGTDLQTFSCTGTTSTRSPTSRPEPATIVLTEGEDGVFTVVVRTVDGTIVATTFLDSRLEPF